MKKEFPGYFANHGQDIERLWSDCLFVLDANVLLNLYRYSDGTRSELLKVFNSLAERVWVPHQVVHEYLTNRLKVIGEIVKIYDESVKSVEALKRALENANHHPFVSADALSGSVALFDQLVGELGERKIIHEGRINSDDIQGELEVLLKEKVGAGFSKSQLEEVLKKGKERYEQRIPPGFKDAKKSGESVVFSDMCKPYGDYIVWLQILEKAKRDAKAVIFVTGDAKEDWWLQFQGKTIGPQPELVQEFLDETNNSFYMYSPDRFLGRANEFLQQETSQDAMNEIRSLQKDDLGSAFNAALLDVALNKTWPQANNDHAEPELPWSDGYQRQVAERQKMLSLMKGRNDRLENLLNFEKARVENFILERQGVLRGFNSSESNGGVAALTEKISNSRVEIESMERELDRLRTQIYEMSRKTDNLER